MSSNTQNNTASDSDRRFGPLAASTGNTGLGGTNTERTGYDSSPLSKQPEYGQGTTTAQHDSPRFGEENTQKRYGQEGDIYRGQDTGLGGGDSGMKAKTDTYQRPTEQTGATTTMGGTQTGLGDTTGRHAGDTTTSSGFGTDIASGEGHHHKHHLGGSHGQGVTTKPSMKDKIVGDAEQLVGKMTSNPEKVQHGAQRATGETPQKYY